MRNFVRTVAGFIGPAQIQDPETRRVVAAIIQRVQYIFDNWPAETKPFEFLFSVANFNGRLQLKGDEVPVRAKRYYGHDAAGALGWFLFPESADVKFQMSVINKSGIVTLVNDKQDPDYGQVYGTGMDAEKGWQYPVEHPWRWQQTSETGGDLTSGLVRIDGIDQVHGMPANVNDLTESMRYWIAVDTTAKTAIWVQGTVAAFPQFPPGDANTIIYPILTIEVDTRTETIEEVETEIPYITGFEQHRFSDIAIGATGGGEIEVKESIEKAGDDKYHLVNDNALNTPNTVYGVDYAGVKGWKPDPTGTNAVTDVVWDGEAEVPTLYYVKNGVRVTIDTPINHADLHPPL